MLRANTMELVVRSYRGNIAWDTRQMYLKNELRKMLTGIFKKSNQIMAACVCSDNRIPWKKVSDL